MPVITRFGGGAASTGLPEFTYTGMYQLIDDENKNWRVKFLTSGTLTFEKNPGSIDVFCVGGGGMGGRVNRKDQAVIAGAGGCTKTVLSVIVEKDATYGVTVGAGSTSYGGSNRGGTSRFGGLCSAIGGESGPSGESNTGTAGGSGGLRHYNTGSNINGGSNGSNGGGTGQGTTTREFGEASGQLYSGGGGIESTANTGGAGGGGKSSDHNNAYGAENTGGGGACGQDGSGNHGGSGIVIIRNKRAA